MKRWIWGVVAASVAVGSVVVARRSLASADEGVSTLQRVRAERRDVGAVVKATGIIKPRVGAEVKVGSRISGVVRHLYVQVGDRVARGQLLAQLDDRDFVARRTEATATLHQAEADSRYAASDLQRKRALHATGGLAQAELEVAERAADVAEQRVLGARASLAYAMSQVEYARIVAPIAGVVASVSTQEGETVAASFAAPTFLTLIDPTRLEIWAYVDETDIGRIELGQHARFTVDTYGDEEFEGHATAVYPKAEIRDNVVNYVTVLRFDPPAGRTLRPEMTTTVRIALDAREHAIALPIRAVRWQEKRAFVLVPRAAGTEKRWVTTGIKDDNYWEIVAGVREGDEVLVGESTSGGPTT